MSSKDNRITVKCNLLKNKRIKFIEAVYDTGAKYTCFRASFIDSTLKEDDFQNIECKYLSGFVGNQASVFYKYEVDRLAFGNIDLGRRHVWITFNTEVTEEPNEFH